MDRRYSLDINFHFLRPLKIDVTVVLENKAKEAEAERLAADLQSVLKTAEPPRAEPV